VNWLRDWLGSVDGGKEVAEVHYRDQGDVRYLHLGSDTIQSAMRISDPVRLELAYSRAMLSTLLFRPAPTTALLIGLGGGSLAKYLHHRLPECRLEAVECNPTVVDVARAHFSLPADDARFKVHVADGAAWLAARVRQPSAAPGSSAPAVCPHDPVDLLLLDVYDARAQVAACATSAFFADAACVLTAQGVCAVNFWSNAPEYPVYRDRFFDAFSGRALLLPVARPGNMIGIGFASADGDWRWKHLRDRARQLEAVHAIEFGVFVESLRQANPYSENRLLI